MLTVYSEDHRYQDAKFELIDGTLKPPVENPRRAEIVLNRIREVGLGEIMGPEDFGLEPVGRVHDERFITFLHTAHEAWRAVHGDTDALPLSWPSRDLRQIEPEAIDGKLGFFSFDAGSPITAGTWRAATAAVNVALTGANLLGKEKRAVFALCRPPGHHAARDLFAGYCFLNNAAIAAQALRDAGAGRACILDVDYHHGNGTQSIFYHRSDVLFVSLHAHPAQEYPYFLGYEDETGAAEGEGFNANYPMRWGTTWNAYGEALGRALDRIKVYGPDVLVVSLGVDTFERDPISRFKLKSEDYLAMGRAIAGIGCPTLFVLEGGYAIDELGVNVVNVLTGFESG